MAVVHVYGWTKTHQLVKEPKCRSDIYQPPTKWQLVLPKDAFLPFASRRSNSFSGLGDWGSGQFYLQQNIFCLRPELSKLWTSVTLIVILCIKKEVLWHCCGHNVILLWWESLDISHQTRVKCSDAQFLLLMIRIVMGSSDRTTGALFYFQPNPQ